VFVSVSGPPAFAVATAAAPKNKDDHPLRLVGVEVQVVTMEEQGE